MKAKELAAMELENEIESAKTGGTSAVRELKAKQDLAKTAKVIARKISVFRKVVQNNDFKIITLFMELGQVESFNTSVLLTQKRQQKNNFVKSKG